MKQKLMTINKADDINDITSEIIEEHERLILKHPAESFKCGFCEECGEEELVEEIDGELLCSKCIERM